MLNAGTDDIAITHRDAMGDAVATVHHLKNKLTNFRGGGIHKASQRTVVELAGLPRSGQGEQSLDSDVKAGHIERLEHYLGSEFAVLRRVQRWFCLKF